MVVDRVRHARLSLLAAVLVIAASTLLPAGIARATGHLVRITSGLEPASLTIAPGDTVTWRNDDDERHRIRARSGPEDFDSGDLEPGESFSVTLSLVGTYDYRDERDPDLSNYWGSIVVAIGATATPGPSGPGATAPPAPTVATVRMAGRRFNPASVTIVAGSRVDWINDDDRDHTVTGNGGTFDSGLMGTGATFQKVFPSPGTFGYLCLIHPDMTGTVTVTATPGSTPPPPTPTPVPSATPPPPSGDIEIVDFAYAPASIEVDPGTRLTFANRGVAIHTVTATDGSFDSGFIPAGGTFARTFDSPGTVAFLCTLHPSMSGEIRVRGASGSVPPPQSPTPAPPAPPGTVRMVDFAFLPGRIRIDAGSTVRFVNDGVAPHTATARGGAFDTGVLARGAAASIRLDEPGTYAYLCAIHPDMTGTIEVAGADGGVPPPSTAPPAPVPSVAPDVGGIAIVDLAFEPPVLAVPVGTTVRWVNQGVAIHTATAFDGSFDSGFLATGDAFERRFDAAGTFEYLCALHPAMVGSIVVEEDPAGSEAPPTAGSDATPMPTPGDAGAPGGPPPPAAGGDPVDPLGAIVTTLLTSVALFAGALVVRGVVRRAGSSEA